MSSSVSYAYTVRQEALRRERERRAAEDALQGARRRREELRREAQAQQRLWGEAIELPAALAAPSGSASTEQLTAARRDSETATEAARARLAEQVVGARIAAMESGMARLGDGVTEAADAASGLAERRREVERERTAQAEQAAALDDEEVEAAVLRLVGRLEADAPASAIVRVESAAESARAASPGSRREQLLDALRAEVQAANEETAERRRRSAEIDRLDEQLDGCRGPLAGAARQLLASLRPKPDPLPGGLNAMVREAVEDEDRRSRAEYVAKQLAQTLQGMGYDLGPGFSTAVAGGAQALATRPGWAGYAVAVNCNGDPPRLDLGVVRGEASRADQAARDLEVEREFCAGRPKLLAELSRVGIDASQAHLVEEGTAPLRIEPALAATAPRQTESKLKEQGQ